jgi:hypothetical protein
MWRAAVFVTVIIGLVLYEGKMRRERTRLLNNRAIFGDRHKIFVVLSGYSWRELKCTIYSLYKQAFLPQRIVVGVAVNPCEVSQTSAEEQFKNFPYQVKFLVHPEHYNLGGAATRKLVLDKLHAYEPYVFLMHAHSKMAPQWDVTLTTSLGDAFLKGCHLVTQVPLNVEPAWEAPVDRVAATFPVLHTDTLHNRLPTFSGRTFVELDRQYEVPCVSSKCLFGTALVIKQVTEHVVPLLMCKEDDFVLSVMCFSRGARAVTPLSSVLYHINDSERKHAYTDYESKKLIEYKEGVIEKLLTGERCKGECPSLITALGSQCNLYVQWLGIDVCSGSLPGHLILGLPREYVEREVLDKFGDMTTFHTFRRKFCYN